MFNLFNLLSTENPTAKKPLSESSKQLLSQQIFTNAQPNAIVQDFETFIEFLQVHKVEVSTNQNAIAPKYLADINERLSHPTKLDLMRHNQKSYPYIHGLYLVLRSSAIAQVQPDKKKNILKIDPQVLQSWQELNDTEKYFNLLATWIFYADESIMNNERRGLIEWWHVLNAWQYLPTKGLTFNNPKDNDWFSRIKLHNVALLNLFGFIEVKDTEPLAGKGWNITKAKPLAFGIAMMELFQKTNWQAGLFLDSGYDLEEQSMGIDVVVQPSTPTEVLQEEFQALDLFPTWEKNLQLPEPESKDGIFIFKVSLKTAWRKIAIPSNFTLNDFSSAILKAFNFYNDHLHQFTYKDRQGFKQSITHPYSEEPPSTDKVLIRDWQIEIGDRITYVFDFGDWWEFSVVLESIDEPDSKINGAKVIDQKGKAPEQYPDYDEEE
jgi:hypothetical protein